MIQKTKTYNSKHIFIWFEIMIFLKMKHIINKIYHFKKIDIQQNLTQNMWFLKQL